MQNCNANQENVQTNDGQLSVLWYVAIMFAVYSKYETFTVIV